MTFNVQKANWKTFRADAVAFFQPEDNKWIADRMHYYGKGSQLHTTAMSLLDHGDMAGRKDEMHVLYPTNGEATPKRILLVGMGKTESITLETVRRAAARAAKKATSLKSKSLAIYLPRVKGAKGAEI